MIARRPPSPPVNRAEHHSPEGAEPPPPYTPEPTPLPSIYSEASGTYFTPTFHPPQGTYHQAAPSQPTHPQHAQTSMHPQPTRLPTNYGIQTTSNRPYEHGSDTHYHPAWSHTHSESPIGPSYTGSSGVNQNYFGGNASGRIAGNAGSGSNGRNGRSGANNGTSAPIHRVPPPLPARQSTAVPSHPTQATHRTPSHPSISTPHGSLGPPVNPSSPLTGGALPPFMPPQTSFLNGNPRMGPSTTDSGPTETPTPGRPLLNKGKVLIYTKGFYCGKCQNTGYKHADPTHPCRTCWSKHSRPYSSAIQHSWPKTSSTDNPDATSIAQNFQRPLRMMVTPQQNQNYRPAQPTWSERWSNPGPSYHPPPLPLGVPLPIIPVGRSQNGNEIYTHPPLPPIVDDPFMLPMPGGWRSPQLVPLPPPGALVVGPGDPRLGGMPCHFCGATGQIHTMGFFGLSVDSDPCGMCRGVGRLL